MIWYNEYGDLFLGIAISSFYHIYFQFWYVILKCDTLSSWYNGMEELDLVPQVPVLLSSIASQENCRIFLSCIEDQGDPYGFIWYHSHPITSRTEKNGSVDSSAIQAGASIKDNAHLTNDYIKETHCIQYFLCFDYINHRKFDFKFWQESSKKKCFQMLAIILNENDDFIT